ncbi:hypothetical protein JCM9957A_25610 [Kineosporia succinea]
MPISSPSQLTASAKATTRNAVTTRELMTSKSATATGVTRLAPTGGNFRSITIEPFRAHTMRVTLRNPTITLCQSL